MRDELFQIRKEQMILREENILLKRQIMELNSSFPPIVTKSYIKEMMQELKEAKSQAQRKDISPALAKKIMRNKKIIIKNKICSLAGQKNLSLPEIRDIIVEQEQLCSRASFYRYIRMLKEQEKLDFVTIDGMEVLVALN